MFARVVSRRSIFERVSRGMRFSSTPQSGSVTAVYNKKVRDGDISDDPAQRIALEYLDKLYDDVKEFDAIRPGLIAKFKSDLLDHHKVKEETTDPFSWLPSLFSKETKKKFGDVKLTTASYDGIHVNAPRGMYLHGGPGSGKTFTMELFYDCLPVDGKRRVHFNEFMLQVHRMLHNFQKQGFQSDTMIDKCVEALYDEGWVLCFDEFQVTDIADAMIIRRLFDALFARGVVVVITSNRAPNELYKNGIQRELFVPFIDEIKKSLQIIDVQSEVDYRMMVFDRVKKASTTHEDNVYFVTGGKSGIGQVATFERFFDKMTKGQSIHDVSLNVQGRKVQIPRAGKYDDVARFTFDDLCGQAVGASDYYAIASSFHTVFIEDIPQLKLNSINLLRRFITLIDIFYDQRVVLVISATTPMNQLFESGGVTSETDTDKMEIQEVDILGDAKYVPSRSNLDEVFAWQRTLSRLHEMQSPEYLLQAHKKRLADGPSPVRFLSELEHNKLKSADIKRLWDRYDKNKDGTIDEAELKEMLKEITLFRAGHRHVPAEVFDATKDALIPKGSDVIQFNDFKNYFENFGLKVRSS